ncbi:MAG: hypothetical protein JXA99_10855 [Candidatus Lokiarchaeota archaeon]|nr:hypothetical protein [Candidatus Lokiarchaeota archaeon]
MIKIQEVEIKTLLPHEILLKNYDEFMATMEANGIKTIFRKGNNVFAFPFQGVLITVKK